MTRTTAFFGLIVSGSFAIGLVMFINWLVKKYNL